MKYIGRLSKSEEYGPIPVRAEKPDFRVVQLHGLNLGMARLELIPK